MLLTVGFQLYSEVRRSLTDYVTVRSVTALCPSRPRECHLCYVPPRDVASCRVCITTCAKDSHPNPHMITKYRAGLHQFPEANMSELPADLYYYIVSLIEISNGRRAPNTFIYYGLLDGL